MMAYWRHEIALHQTQVSARALFKAAMEIEAEIPKTADPMGAQAAHHKLMTMKTELDRAERTLSETPVGKKGWWDRLVLWVYYWSIKGRYE